jgi:WS/DGAT/MGAT family acyltransferase
MTGVEALMWRLGQRDPRLRATMSLVVTLGGEVPELALRERLSALCAVAPRLRERVRESALGWAPPRWEPDPEFSLDRHISTSPGPLWEMAASVVAEPFEAGRPPWRAVISSTEPNALVLHLHHSYTDGLGGVQLIGELFDFAPRAARASSSSSSSSGSGSGGASPSILDDLVGELGRGVRLWSRAVPWAARTMARAGNEPAELLVDAASVADALRAHAGAAVGPASPILADRSAEVVLAPVLLDLEAMRATARRFGATVNDVFVAGLLDGLARYHTKHGSRTPSLRLGVPISRRDPGVGMQNQLVGAVLRGPLGRLDFGDRVQLVGQIVLQGRVQPWAGLMEDAADAAVRLPGAVAAIAGAVGSLDLLASNLVGPPEPMWLGRIPVVSMIPVGPRTGAAVNATLLSYGPAAAVGLNLDPAAVTDPGVLLDCLAAAFEEGLGG